MIAMQMLPGKKALQVIQPKLDVRVTHLPRERSLGFQFIKYDTLMPSHMCEEKRGCLE